MVLAKPLQPILDDGKHWEADKLERKKVAEYLTPLVESITQPFVISLASDYGTGKTFFIKCWRKDLEAKGISCVYFNAWETDFSQDPLFAFIAAIKRELAPLLGADSKFNKAVKKAGGITLKKALPLGLKALLRLAVGNDLAKEALDITKISDEDLAKAADDFAEERLRSQQSAEDSILEFKKYLADAIAEIIEKKPINHQKIVVFVDDLDRCRPDYAISVLECIKHLFTVPGLVFVLSIDDRQLHQAVKAVYGPAINSDGYLRRFIDWRFQLPKPTLRQFSLHVARQLGIERLGNFKGESDLLGFQALIESFNAFAIPFDLSLREIEQTFTEINLSIRTLDARIKPLSDIVGAFAAIRRRYPNELREFVARTLEPRDFFKVIGSKLSDASFRQMGRRLSSQYHIMVVWTLNETSAEQLRDKVGAFTDEWNRINNKPEHKERADFLRGELDFFNPILSKWQALTNSVEIDENSLASIAYSRLEAVSTYLYK
jgi:hypothetical protein